MKIKTNKSIQRAVDQRPGHSITKFTALHIVYEFAHKASAYDADDLNQMEVSSVERGIREGLFLAEKYDKAVETRIASGGLGVRKGLKTQVVMPKNFGIYVALQETSDGVDYLYFIGTPKEIVAQLETVPAQD